MDIFKMHKIILNFGFIVLNFDVKLFFDLRINKLTRADERWNKKLRDNTSPDKKTSSLFFYISRERLVIKSQKKTILQSSLLLNLQAF